MYVILNPVILVLRVLHILREKIIKWAWYKSVSFIFQRQEQNPESLDGKSKSKK